MEYTDLFDNRQFAKFQHEIEKYNANCNYNKSTSIIIEAIRCFEKHPGLYYILALTYYKSNEYLRATECLKRAIYLDDNNYKYLSLIGCCFFNINDYENAYNYSIKAYELDDKNVDAIITLGKLELVKNNYYEAIEYAKRANSIEANNYKAVRLLSKCYIASGQEVKDILEILNKARNLGNDEDLDIDIIKFLYLDEQYTKCLFECKNIILKNSNSYAAQKATVFVSKIYNKELKEKSEILEQLRINENFEDVFNESNREEKIQFQIDTKNEKADLEENVVTKNKSNMVPISENELIKENRNVEENSLEKALGKLNKLIGLKNVKYEINKIVQLIKYEKNRANILKLDNNHDRSYHFAFIGNPGTGKTTVARMIGDIFYSLGILENGNLVEVDRGDIVGRYIGETAKLTKKAIDRAMGGILFIDEAYSLAKGGKDSNDYGAEAIDTLIKAMEDQRGKFTVILAGYTNGMRSLMKINPGLKSRVNLEIEFPDYEDNELLDIAKSIAGKDMYKLSEDGEKAFLKKIDIEKVDDNFANGRSVRNIIEDSIREKAFRIGDKEVSKEELSTLNSEDFGINIKFNPKHELIELEKELDNMIGLSEVKSIIKSITNTLQLQYRKKEIGLECDDISLNMIFQGSPGTGKTTVARLLGKIFKAIGVLKKGHLVEVTRSDLVGQYVGQTAPKTLEKIKEAYGGVLFIDEAYSLNGKNGNDFGSEALSVLIKEMEDNRNKLIVIMAGYTNEMNELLNLNPGLSSRIKFKVDFIDYTPDELIDIFKLLYLKENYNCSEEALEKVKSILNNLYKDKDKSFGNGRLVRKLFEDIKMNQANRVINDEIKEKEELLKIVLSDVNINI